MDENNDVVVSDLCDSILNTHGNSFSISDLATLRDTFYPNLEAKWLFPREW
jgi:hypothetical protein